MIAPVFILSYLVSNPMQLDQFREYARNFNVVPVSRKLLADGETPLAVYRKLGANRPATFLLESAEHGLTWSRYSFVGVNTSAMLSEVNGQAHWSGRVPEGISADADPLVVLRDLLSKLHTPEVNSGISADELPPLTGGVVGFLGYDIVRRFEKLPEVTPDVLQVPELAMFLATDLAVIDHEADCIFLIANAINYDNSSERVDLAWDDAIARLNAMEAQLLVAQHISVSEFDRTVQPEINRETSSVDYQSAVEVAKEHIRAGDAFQIVLPEALVRLVDGQAMLHPIAGTRPRGDSAEADAALAEDLLADKKERAEHLMLVDLGRNDLGRVCEPGTVDVTEFMHIERYSHVMHIVSTVVGQVDSKMHPLDLVRATFPAGTLSGAPKPMAMEIIESLETSRRGIYGGCLGYFDFAGNLDTAIAIRSALLKDGKAYVQAGAGVVADSVAASEDAECQAKAAAVLRAVAAAENG